MPVEKEKENEKSDKKAPQETGPKKLGKDGKPEKPEKEPEELTPEEKKLKEDLELYVERAQDPDPALQKAALNGLASEIRSATSTMTSVPLPLKFLTPHYGTLRTAYETTHSENKKLFADVLSVLSMTMGDSNLRDCLRFKLEGSPQELESWGQDYVRHLAGEVGKEWIARNEADNPTDDLLGLVEVILPFKMKHNAENEAVDLLIDVDMVERLEQYFTKDNTSQINQYMLACAEFLPAEDRDKILLLAYRAALKNELYPDALRIALKLDNKDLFLETFNATEDPLMKKQLGFILGTQRVLVEEIQADDELVQVAGNVRLSSDFLNLGRDLDVLEPKEPEDIYKSYLVDGAPSLSRAAAAAAAAANRGQAAQGVDSAKQNLASTFVNAFLNCGFGKDKLILTEGSDWLYKNKSHGMLSAAASVGMLVLWDVETGFNTVDKYSFSTQPQIKAGVLLATGILTSGVASPEMDAAMGLLSEHIDSPEADMRIAAIYGLGLAYAGSCREDVLELLVPLVVDPSNSIEIVSMTYLALGMVFVGSKNDGLSGTFVETFMERSANDLKDPVARFMCLGLGLLYLGQGDACEGVLVAIKAIEGPLTKYLELTVQSCAYFATSNVLELQKLVQACGEHMKEEDDEEKDKEGANNPAGGAAAGAGGAGAGGAAAAPNAAQEKAAQEKAADRALLSMHQEVAVLGIAMVAMGEDLASAMAIRTLDHILQCGEVNVRRAIPLALGLLSISNPRLTVMDTLSKLTHDQDQQVSQNAILAMGFLGAGTNNSRIAGQLRQLASFYAKEPNHLFLVRIAQGMLHMGKGLMTLSPFSSNNFLFSKVSAAGLLTVFHAAFDMKNTILNKRHYLLFSLCCSARPRMLVTLDENLKSIAVSVRVGQAVDTAGQAGKPKTITGFQSHTTPVLLAANERAELATDQYIPLSPVLEGFVIVKKNPLSTYVDEIRPTLERQYSQDDE